MLEHSDESTLYTLSTFGDSSAEKAIMLFMNGTDGAINESPYYSGVKSCTKIYSFILSNSVFYYLLKCNGDIFISSIDKSSMKSTSFKINNTNVIAYSLTIELTTDRIIFVGQAPSSECYIGKVPRLGIYLHQDVSNSTVLSFAIFDNSTFYIGNENGAISAAISYSSGMHTEISRNVFTSDIGSNNTVQSKVSFILNPISIPSVTAGNVGSTIINGSCSIDGTSYISLLTLSNGSNYPDWISFNSVSNNFSWTSPLNVNSSQLSLQNCVADTSFPTKIANPKYAGCTEILLNIGTSFVSEYDGSKILGFSIFSYAAIAFVPLLCATLSAFNLSSMAVLWMMFGQMKICQMLLLQDGYVSEYVKRYILGFKFSLFNFAFLDFKNKVFVHLPGFSSLITWLDFTQENNKIGDLGYESGSAFINNINLFTTYAFTFVLHILVWILTKVLINCCKISRTRIFVRALILILKSFALGAYIRICIEATQGILITTISEMYLYDRSSTSKVGSFAISIVMFVCEIIIFILIGVLCFCLKREPINNELNLRICETYKNLFDELKYDLKQALIARGYNFIDIAN